MADVFGSVREDGTRQYKTVHVETPRKNGKSTLSAGVALYLLYGDQEQGCEVYSAATDKDQAKIVWDVAKQMVQRNSYLRDELDVVDYKNEVHSQFGQYKAIASDAPGSYGFNTSGAIFDEIHALKGRELYDSIEDSMEEREQPIMWCITTAGASREGVAWEMNEHTKGVMRGDRQDPTHYGRIFSAHEYLKQEDAKWTDDQAIIEANPKLWEDTEEGFGSLKSLKEERDRAIDIPSKSVAYKRFKLNLWGESESGLIDRDQWDNCTAQYDERDLKNKPCYLGLDLAAKQDLVAVSAVWVFPECPEGCDDHKPKNPHHLHTEVFLWAPEDTIDRRTINQGVPYRHWVKQGDLTPISGPVVREAPIEDKIDELATAYDVRELHYDKWQSSGIVDRLSDSGLDVVEVRQRPSHMNAPTRELGARVASESLTHEPNQCMSWQVGNLVVEERSEMMHPARESSSDKIDGVVATIMALDPAVSNDHQVLSVYEERGVRSI